MKLTLNALQDKAWWQERGYQLPLYDIPRVRAATFSAPRWLHLGAGNIFRAFLAHAQQRLLNQRDAESGIIVAEGFDPEIIEKAYRPCDNLSIFVRLKGDRTLDKIVLASVVESLTMRDDFERLRDIAAAPSLQMISLTITEKGYGKRTLASEYPTKGRGGKGIKTANITEKNGPLAGLMTVNGQEDLMIITNTGVIIRTSVANISQTGRSTMGVKVMRLDQNAQIVTFTSVTADNEKEEDED